MDNFTIALRKFSFKVSLGWINSFCNYTKIPSFGRLRILFPISPQIRNWPLSSQNNVFKLLRAQSQNNRFAIISKALDPEVWRSQTLKLSIWQFSPTLIFVKPKLYKIIHLLVYCAVHVQCFQSGFHKRTIVIFLSKITAALSHSLQLFKILIH